MTAYDIRERIQDLTSIIEEAHSLGLPSAMTINQRIKRDELRGILRGAN